MARRSSRRSGEAAGYPGAGRDGTDEAGVPVPTAGQSGRWRLRNWSLRTKLLAVLLIPTLTAVALIGLRLVSEQESADRLEQLSTRVSMETSLAKLVHTLQRERDITVRYVARGRDGALDEVRTQRERVDEQLGTFSNDFRSARDDLSEDRVAAFDEVDERMNVLTGLRYASEHSEYPPDAVRRSYTELITSLMAIREQAVATIREPELVRAHLAASTLARAKEKMSVERALIAEGISRGELDQQSTRDLLGARAERDAAVADFRTFASWEQQQIYEDTMTGLIVDNGNDISEAVLTRAESDRSLSDLDAEEWDTASTYTINLAAEAEDALLVGMQERTDELADRTSTAVVRDGAIVLGLLLLATVLTMVIARSLLRPLRTLRTTAFDVAQRRLPAAVRGMRDDPGAQWSTEVAPVPVYSREELGQVARAFDAVHGEAVRLAAEQAALRTNVNAMFVNLSQAGRELSERQLAVLDRMEAEERDPENLANLFELDHLAARLRRIGENLLVLTGNDYVRMLPGTVPAAEVLGAALSEIDQYQRVRMLDPPPIAIRGDAVSDVVHIISELLENATNSSEADTAVTVASSMNHRGQWLVEITDYGPGLSQEAIERANARLAEPPEIDVEATRRMGLYVVACLAQRHDLAVWLRNAPSGGLTASLLVPAELINDLPADVSDSSSVGPLRRPDLRKTDALERPGETGGAHSPAPAPAGPPKRAPVVGDGPAAGSEGVQPHPLDDEQPTERFPAYQDLLTRWFEALRPGEAGDQPVGGAEPEEAGSAEEPDSGDAGENAGEDQSPEPANDGVEHGAGAGWLDAPTIRNITRASAAIGVNLTEDDSSGDAAIPPASRGELDLGDGLADLVDYAGSPAMETVRDLAEHGREPAAAGVNGSTALEVVSRDPEAVRQRMVGLLDGLRRARQESPGE
ncbi:sensor histidine kinase [Haloechinothrix sp. YIM 98757]|uniref:histidine kinase n=1 Tax=Haloechinothrix aidingensis TaxID=2752311 RepID=A0A838AEG1_9PSEU|nr:sensor histidine kinase [Haloechinothrix aidingensis]